MDKYITNFRKGLWEEFLTQIIPLFDYDKERMESLIATKHLTISPKDISVGLDRLAKDDNRKILFVLAYIRRIFIAISDLIPAEFENEDDKSRGERIKETMNQYSSSFGKIYSLVEEDVNKGIETPLIAKSDFLDISLSLSNCFQMYLTTYELFHGSKENKNDSGALLSTMNQLFGMLSSCQQTIGSIAANTQETNTIVKSSENNLNTINKKADQLLQEQKETQRKMIVQGARSSRENKKLEDKITKRNQKESRNELTQMDCARIIAEERKINYEAKKSLLDALKMSTETIDKDKNPDEENIVRTIERWDTGETKPPVGYSRRISEYEFREWVKKREKRKLDNWIVKIRRSLKTVQAELVPEAVLDEWMRLNTGNDNDPYSKINA
jgi:hypothetical protein